MSRCEAIHPLTQQQCVAEQGHAGPHDLPARAEVPPEVKREQLQAISADLFALLPGWAARGFPPEAMIAELMSFTIDCARAAGMPERTLLISFIGMSSPAECPVDPSPHDAVAYVAGVLLGLNVAHVRTEEIKRPSPEAQPS